MNENNFRRASASGRALFAGRPNASDWKVETIVEAESDAPKADTAAPGSPHSVGAGVPGDDPGSEGESPGSDVDMDVAPAGRLPFMEASLRVTVADAATGAPPPAEPEDEEDDDAGQPIARLDLNTLEAYLGVAGATVAKSATVLPGTGAAAAPAPLPSLARDDTTASTELAAAAAMLASGTPRTGGDSESVPGSEGDAEAVAAKGKEKDKDVTAAQSAARAAFAKDSTQDEDDFFSSDEESNPADAEARSATSFATSTSNRFMINIRSPEETPRAASGGDTASLRAAVSNLKLGGLPPPSPQASASGAAPNTVSPRLPYNFLSPQQILSLFYNLQSLFVQLNVLRVSLATALQDRPSEQGTSSARSSVSSMEMFPTLASLPTITTPPPAMPQAEASSEDFFANFGAPTPPPAAAQTAPDATSAAAPAAQAVIKDPFAELPGLPQTLSQAAKTTEPKAPLQSTPSGITPGASEPLPLHAFHSGDATSAPMRPQAPAPLPQSDLLAGWDEFESMFGGGASTPAPAAAASTAPPAIPAPIEPPAIAPVVASSDSAEPPAAVKKLHKKATEAFCKGLWAKAADQYGEILGTVAGTPEAAAFTQQCVFEYAAALLVMRAAAAPPAAASRLARHAASLPIAQEQLAIVTAFAIEANMAAGNYGWAGDQLSGLLVLSAEGQVGGPGLEPKTLQDRLEACDRAGNANADLPGDEDAEIFASIVGSCQGKGDVDELVGDLTRG